MSPIRAISRSVISVAILAAIALLFSTDTYSQNRCSEWNGFRRVTVPCPSPTPRRGGDDVVIPPEDPRISEAREQNDLGMKAQSTGNWRLAAQHFQLALEKQPHSTLYRDNWNNAVRQIEIEDRKAREAARKREQESLRNQRQKLEAGRDKEGLKPIGGSELFNLKPSRPGSSDLIPLGNREKRNFGEGNQAVWKQLNCAVDLMGQALAKVSPDNGENPSFAESRNLLGEALNALNGDPNGAPCSMGGPLPKVAGRIPDLSRAVKKERDLIERAKVAVDELERVSRPETEEERIAKIYAQQQANQKAIAEREADALKNPRKKRSPNPVLVPTPTSPPKPETKPKTALEKISAEAEELISFHLKRRRSPPPPPRSSPK